MHDQNAQIPSVSAQLKKFKLATIFLALCFIVPLWRLVCFAADSNFFSYILLMPLVCVYLGWLQKKNLPQTSPPAGTPAGLFFASGIATVVWYWLAPTPAVADGLAQVTLAFLLFLTGAGFWFLGGKAMRTLAFPFALLVFMIPPPNFLRDGIDTALQHGSATVAGWMFAVSDVPAFRNSLEFQLPNVSLRIAPECSGIHSTLVLFITSLVAGHFFLQQRWKKVVLCLAVIPLALLRNGFRVFVLGELCVHMGPWILNSPIHHHGGPLFFVLSLVPFFLLLYLLKKFWRPENRNASPVSKS